MKKILLPALMSAILLIACGDDGTNKDSGYSVAKISECLRNDTMKSINQDEIDANQIPDNAGFNSFAEIISIENETLTIEMAANFNCATHIKYEAETAVDKNDPSLLLLKIKEDTGGVVATCACPKVLTFTTKGNPEDLKKINKLKLFDSDTSQYVDVPLTPAD